MKSFVTEFCRKFLSFQSNRNPLLNKKLSSTVIFFQYLANNIIVMLQIKFIPGIELGDIDALSRFQNHTFPSTNFVNEI